MSVKPGPVQFDDIYHMGIKEPARSVGVRAERVDEQIFREGMLARIYRQIEAADIVIADMSGQNANVFYEVGFAHGRDKLCILLTQDADDIPFDLKHLQHIVYESSINKLRELLVPALEWARSELETKRDSGIDVKIQPLHGGLKKTERSAKGSLLFRINIHNTSEKEPVGVDAMYFYSSNGWVLTQGEEECPRANSDLVDFEQQHLLKSPVSRLGTGAWAQLKFTAEKYLAFASRGDQLKDSYPVNGRAVLRLITPEGKFDYHLPIKAECDDIPF